MDHDYVHSLPKLHFYFYFYFYFCPPRGPRSYAIPIPPPPEPITTMPTAAATVPIHGPVDLLTRLDSPDPNTKLKALREIKNQVIGNRTKKLSFLKLAAIPAVASILSSAAAEADSQLANADVSFTNIIVQSAAVLGSFACGFNAGVRAVLNADAFPSHIRILSNPDKKVIMLFFY